MVILLAEDDVQVQYFIWKLLKADGFMVLTGGNGVFALEASRNHPGPVDLLLTDMEMPRMGGLELTKTIAAERPGIKVLMMSGDLRDREQVSGMDCRSFKSRSPPRPCGSQSKRCSVHPALQRWRPLRLSLELLGPVQPLTKPYELRPQFPSFLRCRTFDLKPIYFF